MGIGIILILVSIPYLFYFYKYAPNEGVWETNYFTISSGGFRTVKGFVHALFTKIIFFISFSIWFLTCRHWWKYAILVPLTLFLFQLSGVLNQQLDYIDEYDFWYSLPIVIPIIILILFLSRKLKFYIEAIDLKDKIEAEIKSLRNPS